jgi:hypothetical protein
MKLASHKKKKQEEAHFFAGHPSSCTERAVKKSLVFLEKDIFKSHSAATQSICSV